MKKPIEFTKQQYRELLLSLTLGIYIREGVAEARGEDFNKIRNLEDYLLSFAKDFDSIDMVETFGNGILILSDEVCEESDEIIEEYDDGTFWHHLITDLGQRDFYRTVTTEEDKVLKKEGGRLPERVHEIYEWYEKEFEQNGIENIKIIKKDIEN